jgi:hypothetical protein
MSWTVMYAKRGERYETDLPTFSAAVGFIVDGYEDGTYAGLRIIGPDGRIIEGDALNEAKRRFTMPERYGPLSKMEG